MHTYLKSIGFSNIKTQAEIDKLIQEIFTKHDSMSTIEKQNSCKINEYTKEFAENIGITVRGEEDDKGIFRPSYLFPFLKGKEISCEDEMFIHKKVDNDAYTGMCDDARVGVSLIFYLQNVIDYMEYEKKEEKKAVIPVYLNALARSGKVILPTQRRVYSNIVSKFDNAIKTKLLEDAKNGDRQAMESLTMNDIDKYALVNERIKHEDLFSIVETTFIPYGSESDVYNILANIISARQIKNSMTGELVWILKCNCNDVVFDVCINSKDLLGEPIPGMRFKGTVWLQGVADFS